MTSLTRNEQGLLTVHIADGACTQCNCSDTFVYKYGTAKFIIFKNIKQIQLNSEGV